MPKTQPESVAVLRPGPGRRWWIRASGCCRHWAQRDSGKVEVGMTTELVLLGVAGAPMPVAGRGGISSALIIDERVFLIDCGRGSPSAFADAGLDFSGLEG